MPTYEYGCRECRHEWEESQRITAPPTEVCPKCGKTSAHRLISAGAGFILKGGGWYSDLYSSPSASKKNAEESPAAPADASKKEAPAAKPETTTAPAPSTTTPGKASSTAEKAA
jgi:putative FmdB family regulatory protein